MHCFGSKFSVLLKVQIKLRKSFQDVFLKLHRKNYIGHVEFRILMLMSCCVKNNETGLLLKPLKIYFLFTFWEIVKTSSTNLSCFRRHNVLNWLWYVPIEKHIHNDHTIVQPKKKYDFRQITQRLLFLESKLHIRFHKLVTTSEPKTSLTNISFLIILMHATLHCLHYKVAMVLKYDQSSLHHII